MGKLLKSLIGVVVGLAVIALLVLIVVASRLDRIIKRAAETYGPEATGTSVTLDGAETAHQLVVLGVADLGDVPDVVQVVVVVDLRAQLLRRQARLLDSLFAAAHGSLRILRQRAIGKGADALSAANR